MSPWPATADLPLDAMREVLNSNRTTDGPALLQLESRIADATSRKYAVGMSSGTAALEAALLAAGVRHGDQVVVPAFGFQAAGMAVLAVGARPALVDVSPEDGMPRPDDVAIAAERNYAKAAIVIDLDGFVPLWERAGGGDGFAFALIEDACPALFSHSPSYSAGGSYGLASAISLNETKIVGGGEGGVLVTNSEEVADVARLVRSFGERYWDRPEGLAWRTAERAGRNYRLGELPAALAVASFDRVGAMDLHRRAVHNAEKLDAAVRAAGGALRVIQKTYGTRLHKYRVALAPDVDREAALEALRNRGVPLLLPDVAPLDRHPAFERFGGKFPGAWAFASRTIPIGSRPSPIWWATPGEIEAWSEALFEVSRELRRN